MGACMCDHECVLPWQVAEVLREVQAICAAEGAGSDGTDVAWVHLLHGVERIEAVPEIAVPAGATAPRSLEALRLEAGLAGCCNIRCARQVSGAGVLVERRGKNLLMKCLYAYFGGDKCELHVSMKYTLCSAAKRGTQRLSEAERFLCRYTHVTQARLCD